MAIEFHNDSLFYNKTQQYGLQLYLYLHVHELIKLNSTIRLLVWWVRFPEETNICMIYR